MLNMSLHVFSPTDTKTACKCVWDTEQMRRLLFIRTRILQIYDYDTLSLLLCLFAVLEIEVPTVKRKE